MSEAHGREFFFSYCSKIPNAQACIFHNKPDCFVIASALGKLLALAAISQYTSVFYS